MADGGFRAPGLRKQWERIWVELYGFRPPSAVKDAVYNMTDSQVIEEMRRMAEAIPKKEDEL